MQNLNYNILKSIVSQDGKTVFFLSSAEITIEETTAITYNISAADCCHITTVEDTSTNRDLCENILNELYAKSISYENLKEFISEYLSEH